MPVVIHAWLSNQSDYRAAVSSSIECGGDADTTAAIVGGIVGARVGQEGIPAEWMTGLRDWPRSVGWMTRLSEQLSDARAGKQFDSAIGVNPAAVFLRNVVFLASDTMPPLDQPRIAPGTDRNWFRRVWLNQPVFGSGRAFDINAWREQTDATVVVPDGSLIVLGFDGARRHDATALVAMDVEQSFMWPVGIWTRPEDADDDWEMPSEEIDAAVAMMFDRYDVWRLYGDPPYWSEYLDKWAGEYSDRKGKSRVVSWWTNRKRPMAYALQSFENAIKSAAFTHDGDTTLASHISNSVRHALTIRGEDDKPLWNLRKERSDSPLKIDGAMAATLCWEAYGDCVAAGKPRSKRNRALHSF